MIRAKTRVVSVLITAFGLHAGACGMHDKISFLEQPGPDAVSADAASGDARPRGGRAREDDPGAWGSTGPLSRDNVSCCSGVSCDGVTCVRLERNDQHCGACGNACLQSQFCNDGVCTTCLTQCSGVCADFNWQNINCGGCGRVCPNGQACNEGVCGPCPSGTLCNGVCRVLQSDDYNCGACGRVCGMGQTCVDGVCADSCR